MSADPKQTMNRITGINVKNGKKKWMNGSIRRQSLFFFFGGWISFSLIFYVNKTIKNIKDENSGKLLLYAYCILHISHVIHENWCVWLHCVRTAKRSIQFHWMGKIEGEKTNSVAAMNITYGWQCKKIVWSHARLSSITIELKSSRSDSNEKSTPDCMLQNEQKEEEENRADGSRSTEWNGIIIMHGYGIHWWQEANHIASVWSESFALFTIQKDGSMVISFATRIDKPKER